MVRTVTSALIGRSVARRFGGSGLVGAAAGVGVSILVGRLAPGLGRALFRRVIRSMDDRRTLRAADAEIQTAGA